MVMVLLFHLLYLILPLTVTLAPFYLMVWTDRWAFAATYAATYLSWFAISHHSETDGKGRPWVAFENLWLWRHLFAWFPIQLIPPAKPLSPSKQYIFGVHPHGALAFNRAMFGFCTNDLWDKAFPGIDFFECLRPRQPFAFLSFENCGCGPTALMPPRLWLYKP